MLCVMFVLIRPCGLRGEGFEIYSNYFHYLAIILAFLIFWKNLIMFTSSKNIWRLASFSCAMIRFVEINPMI